MPDTSDGHIKAGLYFREGTKFREQNSEPHDGSDLHLGSDTAAFGAMRDCRLWVFTRDVEGSYVLAATAIVDHTEGPSPEYQHVMVAAPNSTRRFRMIENPTRSVEGVIRSLSIFDGRTPKGALGNLFQGLNHFRVVTREDDEKLAAFAATLKPASTGMWRFKGMPL